jgi:KDO2-lipid IV(A) lauroyltransferase
VFGEEKSFRELNGTAAAMFENFSRSGFECLAYGNLPDSEKREYVQIIGKEKLADALSAGRGVIALSAHMGNFLIMMTRLALEGYSVDLLVKRMEDKRVEERLNNLRKGFGFNSIYLRPPMQSIKTSLRALKDNHVLVILGDQREGQAGVDVTFFGMPATAASGPIALSLSTGAPVLPMFMVRNEDGVTHTLTIEAPLEMSIAGSKEENIRANEQKYTDVIQSYVQRYPVQWAWDHKRWAR